MICRILLLIVLTSCVCGMFEPRNTLDYQAEENDSVTVAWRFSSKANVSIPSLKIHCVFVVPELKVFYHLDNSVEEPQHEQFAGRVQCDKDALRRGRVSLLLSRVGTEDSGRYLCRMATGLGKKVKEFSLNITAAVNKPLIPKPAPAPAPASRSRPRPLCRTGPGGGGGSCPGCLSLCCCSPLHLTWEKVEPRS